MIGAILAAPILRFYTYQALYWITLVPSIGLILMGLWLLKRAPREIVGHRPPIDWLGASLLAGGLLALLLGISFTEGAGWAAPMVLGLLGASMLLLMFWVRQSLASPSPLVELRLLGQPAIGCVAALQLLSGFGIFASFILVPMLVVSPRIAGGLGLDASAASYAMIPFGSAGLIAPFLVQPLRRRIGAPWVLGLSTTLAIAAPLLLLADPGIVQVGIATGLLGFGIGFTLTQSFDLVGAMVPKDRVASLGSLVYLLKMAGSALGGQVAVSLVGAAPNAAGFFRAFVMASIAMLAAAIAAFMLVRQDRRSAGAL